MLTFETFVTFVVNLLQRKIATAAIARMVIPQKIFPTVEDPGIWGQAWRLVLLQKAEKLSIVEKVANAEPSNI